MKKFSKIDEEIGYLSSVGKEKVQTAPAPVEPRKTISTDHLDFIDEMIINLTMLKNSINSKRETSKADKELIEAIHLAWLKYGETEGKKTIDGR